jgi:paired amphipathic helix protein Sin3a
MQAVHSLLERINAMPHEERASFRIEEGMLSPVHYKAIDVLYADSGQVMVDLVKKNPAVALPIVLGRMEKKDAEW